MKKIGIITIYGYQNYGNRLQNLAVQEILRERGFCAESIVLVDSHMKWRWRTLALRKFLQGKILGDIQSERIYRFLAFDRKYIKTKYLFKTDGQESFHSLPEYDYFAVGSDQVWNICMNSIARNSAFYFLRFAEDARKVCISPSIGVDAIPEEYVEQVRQWLSGFRYLSCREKKGAQEITQKNVQPSERTGDVATGNVNNGVESTQKSTQKSTQRIIALMKDNPYITTQEIADQIGIIRRGVAKHIKKLQEKGIIRRVGPDKGGHWEVIVQDEKEVKQ